MRAYKTIMLAAALVILAGAAAYCGETRNIYVGDIITLDIEAKIPADELADKFKDFDIIETKARAGGYEISARTFFTGEHRIIIGDKEIVIDVRSALAEIERDGIFEGGLYVGEPGFPFHFRVLFIIFVLIFAASGAGVLYMRFFKRAAASASPRKLFMARSGALSAYDGNFFVDLTFYFKEYIGSVYRRRIIGKTSKEIIGELSLIGELAETLPAIGEWLTECDRMKFTGGDVPVETKREHYSILADIVREIDGLGDKETEAEG